MNIFNKNLNDITKEDIIYLIDNKIEEGVYIDYKQELKIDSDYKQEFLYDITSFANTDGGYLIFGIEEENKIPIKLTPVFTADIDSLELKINQILINGFNIEPNIKFILKSVKIEQDKYIIVIEIIKTFDGPHRANQKKFYARTSGGKYPLSIIELRNAFLLSDTINKKIENFISDRTFNVINKNNNGILIHVIPKDSFYSNKKINLEFIKSGKINDLYLKPMYCCGGWNFPLYNLKGVITKKDDNYTQFYRNGIVEIFEKKILSGSNKIGHIALEKEIIKYLKEIIIILKSISIECPIIIFIKFLGVSGYIISTGRFNIDNINSQKIDENILELPELFFEDYSFIDDLDKMLKPSFDVYWNACGFEGSKNYNENDKFVK